MLELGQWPGHSWFETKSGGGAELYQRLAYDFDRLALHEYSPSGVLSLYKRMSPTAVHVLTVALSCILTSEPRSGIFGIKGLGYLRRLVQLTVTAICVALPFVAPQFLVPLATDQHDGDDAAAPQLVWLRPPYCCPPADDLSADEQISPCMEVGLLEAGIVLACFRMLTTKALQAPLNFLTGAVIDTVRRYRALYCWNGMLVPGGWPSVGGGSHDDDEQASHELNARYGCPQGDAAVARAEADGSHFSRWFFGRWRWEPGVRLFRSGGGGGSVRRAPALPAVEGITAATGALTPEEDERLRAMGKYACSGACGSRTSPWVGVRNPSNALAWLSGREILLAFGDRFRARIMTYTSIYMLLLLLLLASVLVGLLTMDPTSLSMQAARAKRAVAHPFTSPHPIPQS